MTHNSKPELLVHYAQREPTKFIQIDGFIQGDDVMGRDDDGHAICGGTTYELMRGADVRVLIPEKTSAADAVALLRKAIAWVEAGAIERCSSSNGSEQYGALAALRVAQSMLEEQRDCDDPIPF